MPTSRQPDGGPAGVYSSDYPTDGDASTAQHTRYTSKRVIAVVGGSAISAYVGERHPLLPQFKPDSQPSATRFSILAIYTTTFLLIFLLCSMFYSMMPGPSAEVDYKSLYQGTKVQIQRLTEHNLALGKDVTLYKGMYEDVRVRAVHLEQANAAMEDKNQRLTEHNVALGKDVSFYKGMYEDVRVQAVHLEHANAALEDEIHDLQIKLHDLRVHLTNSKVVAFWEIARTMNTNMDIWVGADDPGGGPKFWSYGITSGLFNDNDPPVTSIKLHFADRQGAVVENTEHRRIVGYKIESNRRNNGWWIATGLDEFGQDGSHEVKFSAKQANRGAEYEVTVFYADWKL